METQLRLKEYLYSLISGNILLSLLISYELFALILYRFSSTDILIPCLFKTLFGHSCPGCGMTTAFGELLSFHFIEAFTLNPLVYPFVLGVGYLLVKDYLKFRRS